MIKTLHALLDSVINNNLFKTPSYGETLEQYIVNRCPKDPSDIERLTTQWQRGQCKERLL